MTVVKQDTTGGPMAGTALRIGRDARPGHVIT